MKLPSGVLYRPRNEVLIAKDDAAVVQIQTTRFPDNAYYRIAQRDDYASEIVPYLRGDWEDFDRLFGFCAQRRVYASRQSPFFFGHAEHQPAASDRRLPDISVFANFSVRESSGVPRPMTVLGCSMGHDFPAMEGRGSSVTTLYEFQSYGALALDYRRGNVELWVARQGDKIAVPAGCLATLYNFDDEDNPLVVLSVTRQEPALRPGPQSRALSRLYGPILLATYDEQEAVFTVNRLHINSTRHNAGVRLPTPLRERHEREIHVPRGARINLGKLLYEELTQNPERIARFACVGIQLRRASPQAVLPSGLTASALHFSRSLYDALEPGSDVERYFRPDAIPPVPPPPRAPRRTESARKTRSDSEKKPLNRPLTIVVEGSGVWVESAYRQLFQDKVAAGRSLSVFYADDTRWKAGRPAWADPKYKNSGPWTNPKESWLQKWEIYLDKADPIHFARYLNLRPDVVFIVTPDFTHCAIAQHWIGKSPLIFIEKPFDSHTRNVQEFRRALANEHRTRVFGLDHFQFYAARIPELRSKIDAHLGGGISEVRFYLTEDRGVEDDRVRTLQHGLTLDLLPHMIALLAYFGDIRTIDDIRVLEAGQYRPLETDKKRLITNEFRSETYSKVHFTFIDDSPGAIRIPCFAVVGKGFPKEVKLLELTGRGPKPNRVRLDLRKRSDPAAEYPYDSLIFLLHDQAPPAGAAERRVTDPYFGKEIRYLAPPPDEAGEWEMMRSRYELLLDDLLDQTEDSIPSTLSLEQGDFIVDVLDRIWRAIRASPMVQKARNELTLGEL